LELVKILEASSESLRRGGSAVSLQAEVENRLATNGHANSNGHAVSTNGRHNKEKNGKFRIPVASAQESRVTV
jgi:hypothetical protein